MTRRIGLWSSLSTLGVGLLLGWAAGRFVPSPLAAQGQQAAQAEAKTVLEPGSDEALYAQLDQQYERFKLVDQTFALVARAVSPSVVHIVARKTGQSREGARTHFDETGSGVIVRAEADNGRGRFVLTNNHVIEGASDSQVSITLN